MTESFALLTREEVIFPDRIEVNEFSSQRNSENGNILTSLQTLVRKGFRLRLFQAHAALEGREGGRVSREEIGKRVGKALGVGAINQSTVASWFTDILPPADIGVGLAVVYEVPAGWLYFDEARNYRPLPIEEGAEEPAERPTKRLRRKKA